MVRLTAAPWNLLLVLWGVPELSRAWVTEDISWTTGGGCLQSLALLHHDVVVSFLCWAGGGWGKGSVWEDLVLESPSIET